MNIFKETYKHRKNETSDTPYEGIFWLITNNNNDRGYVVYAEQVDTSGKWSTTLEHIKIWEDIKNEFTVDEDIVVDYDYFPRGRIMINPIYENNKFQHYDVYIYLDKCINNIFNIQVICRLFNIKERYCNIKYIGADGGITSNHYTYHDCR